MLTVSGFTHSNCREKETSPVPIVRLLRKSRLAISAYVIRVHQPLPRIEQLGCDCDEKKSREGRAKERVSGRELSALPVCACCVFSLCMYIYIYSYIFIYVHLMSGWINTYIDRSSHLVMHTHSSLRHISVSLQVQGKGRPSNGDKNVKAQGKRQ